MESNEQILKPKEFELFKKRQKELVNSMPKRGKNLTPQEWALEGYMTKINYLGLVSIDGVSIPVINRICPLCWKGWTEPFKYAVKNNVLYHKACLEKRGLMNENVDYEH